MKEVRSERWSKVIAQTVIKTVNNEGTNLRHWGQEEFVPNRQDEETRSLSIVNRSGSKLTWVGLSQYSN